MDKKILMEEVIQTLERDLQLIADASATSRQAATEAEAKAEHKYDTRGLEQSYLANGQAKRGLELMESIAILKSVPLLDLNNDSAVQISAIVDLESEAGERQTFFMLPQRGGIKISHNEKEILTLSLDSPMGEAIFMKSIGDSVEVKIRSQIQTFTILSIH